MISDSKYSDYELLECHNLKKDSFIFNNKTYHIPPSRPKSAQEDLDYNEIKHVAVYRSKTHVDPGGVYHYNRWCTNNNIEISLQSAAKNKSVQCKKCWYKCKSDNLSRGVENYLRVNKQ